LILTPKDRLKCFKSKFPQYSGLIVHNNSWYGHWVVGCWIKNDKELYGAYPHNLPDRILALFPDCHKIMHLFSGTIRAHNNIYTFDISNKYNPTICDDIRNIKNHKDIISKIDIILADPPYAKEDFKKYGYKPFNKNQVIRDLGEIMKPGAFLVWLDTWNPMYKKETWFRCGIIGVTVGTNSRARVLTFFQRIGNDSEIMNNKSKLEEYF